MYFLLCSKNLSIEEACKRIGRIKMANGFWQISRDASAASVIALTFGMPVLVIADSDITEELIRALEPVAISQGKMMPGIISIAS